MIRKSNFVIQLTLIALVLMLQSFIKCGCADSDASNYDPNEELDDLSCVFEAEPSVAIQLPDSFAEYTGDSFEIQIRIDDDRGIAQAYVSTFHPLGTKIQEAGIGERFREEDKIAVREWMVLVDHDNDWEHKHLGWYALQFDVTDIDGNVYSERDSVLLALIPKDQYSKRNGLKWLRKLLGGFSDHIEYCESFFIWELDNLPQSNQ
tara:strand:- start:1176 stop:1793 length:618 start_codon:yes stop_codon:yes gene_type:complete